MPHALFPVNPVTVFIGIFLFLLSIILYTLKELVKYAQVFWSKRTQQTNLAISKDTPSTTSSTEGGKSPHVIFRPIGPVSPETATGNGMVIRMAEIPDPKKHLEDEQRKRLPKDTQIINYKD